MDNRYLSYIAQRFWLPEEGRMLNAGSISFGKKIVFDAHTPNSYLFTSKSKILWLMPTFMFDKNNKMIYQHDIVKGYFDDRDYIGRVEFRYNQWHIIPIDGGFVQLYKHANEVEVVGNMFENASLMSEET